MLWTYFIYNKSSKTLYMHTLTLQIYSVLTLQIYSVLTLQIYSVLTLQIYSVLTLQIYSVLTLQIYSVLILQIYSVLTLQIYSEQKNSSFIYCRFIYNSSDIKNSSSDVHHIQQMFRHRPT